MYHLEQLPEETIEDLAFRAERLAAVIAPHRNPADREELFVLPAFLDAIEDDEISFELRKIGKLNLKTALREARRLRCLKEIQHARLRRDGIRTPDETDLENEVSESESLKWPCLQDDDVNVTNDPDDPVVEAECSRVDVVEILPESGKIVADLQATKYGQGEKVKTSKRRRHSPDVVVWNSSQKNRRNRLEGLGEIISRSRRNSDGEQSDYSREGSPVRRSRLSRASRQ